jgi:hypothetical protein
LADRTVSGLWDGFTFDQQGARIMSQANVLADSIRGSVGLVQMHLGDFSEADMHVRPVASANTAAWQLGHIIGSDVWMFAGYMGSAAPKLPDGFQQTFGKESAKKDDHVGFPKKEELIKLLGEVRGAIANWVATLTDADLAKPGPKEMAAFCPTLGSLIALTPTHLAMHLGQIQVIRRKLGKPNLF